MACVEGMSKHGIPPARAVSTVGSDCNPRVPATNLDLQAHCKGARQAGGAPKARCKPALRPWPFLDLPLDPTVLDGVTLAALVR